jgi:hypothetical protein
MIGNENLPSVKSSAKPLLLEYCMHESTCSQSVVGQSSGVFQTTTYLGALKIHQIVANLKVHPNEVYEGYKITLRRSDELMSWLENDGMYSHISVSSRAGHHEPHSNPQQSSSLCQYMSVNNLMTHRY